VGKELLELYVTNPDTRVNSMDLKTVQIKVCKSAKDIYIFWELAELMNPDGLIIIPRIKDLAEKLDVSRQAIFRILKDGEKADFFYKEGTGIYRVNPFIFIGKRVRKNEDRERLQKEWKELTMHERNDR